jgi:hypothetical protein
MPQILSHFRKFLNGHLWSAAALLPLSQLGHAAIEKAEARPRGRKSTEAQLPLRVLYFWAGDFRWRSRG